MRAEELPAELGIFRVVTFAQSFHWMEREKVAQLVRGMLSADGAWVHVSATTHRGVAGDDPLPCPRPPWDRVDELVASYLGPVRRAGQRPLPEGTRSGEDEVRPPPTPGSAGGHRDPPTRRPDGRPGRRPRQRRCAV
jgi:hypothetical protein